MSQNSQSPTLPTARKTRRASRGRPVLVSSTSQSTAEVQASQVETLEPEDTGNAPSHIEPLVEEAVAVDVPKKSPRASRLPGFFSKVEKTVEEPQTSQEEVVKARLARAQKTTSKVEVTTATDEAKKEEKSAPKTASTARPRMFKTRHFIGMMIYLFGAEIILPIEASFSKQIGIEQPLTTVFNITITTSIVLNLATLLILLVVLVKLDLLPTSLAGRSAATTRTQQHENEQRVVTERQPQPTMRQGVKGADDDLYQAYRSNQRREKKR